MLENMKIINPMNPKSMTLHNIGIKNASSISDSVVITAINNITPIMAGIKNIKLSTDSMSIVYLLPPLSTFIERE